MVQDLGGRLLRKCEEKEMEGNKIEIIEEDPHGSWFLVRGAVPGVLVEELLAFAERHRNTFWNVHCVHPGDIARMLLGATKEHRKELKANKEDNVINNHRDATILDVALRRCWKRVAKYLLDTHGLIIGELQEREISRSGPGSLGQKAHMDMIWNAMSQLLCLMGGVTGFARYKHQLHPANVSAESTVPHGWDTLERVQLQWEKGDILLMYQNLIHWAPPNPSKDYRYVCFLGGSVLDGGEYSDTKVITEDVFSAFRYHHTRITPLFYILWTCVGGLLVKYWLCSGRS